MDGDEPSFFDLLGRDPDADDGAVLAPSRKSLEEVDGDYADIAESDFVRLEALEAKPTKKLLHLPKLTLPVAQSAAPATTVESAAAAAQDESAEISLEELMQQDFERQRAETAREEQTKKEPVSARVSLTARLRGRSVSGNESGEIVPAAKTRTGRSRTISEVVSGILRHGSRDAEPVHAGHSNSPNVAAFLADAAPDADDGEPMAFGDFLEQEQQQQQPASSSSPVMPPKRSTILTRARNASIGGLSARRKSPLVASRSSANPTDGTTSAARRCGDARNLSSAALGPDDVGRLLNDPEVAMALLDHAKDAMCEENVEAMMLIREFRLATTEYMRRRAAETIMARFVADSALKPVNIDARTRQNTKSEMAQLKEGKAIPLTLFDGVMGELSLLTHTDMLPRFWTSTNYKLAKESLALRFKLGLPEVGKMEEQLRAMCSLRHWHAAEPGEGGLVEMWDADAAAAKNASVSLAAASRGSVRVAANAALVVRALMELDKYGDWLQPVISSSVLDKKFGSFFRLAELQVALDATISRTLHMGAVCVASTLVDYCIALVTASADRHGAKGSKALEVQQGGFIVTPEDDVSCRVVFVLALKPSKKVSTSAAARSMVMQLLLRLRDRKLQQPHVEAELPEEMTL